MQSRSTVAHRVRLMRLLSLSEMTDFMEVVEVNLLQSARLLRQEMTQEVATPSEVVSRRRRLHQLNTKNGTILSMVIRLILVSRRKKVLFILKLIH